MAAICTTRNKRQVYFHYLYSAYEFDCIKNCLFKQFAFFFVIQYIFMLVKYNKNNMTLLNYFFLQIFNVIMIIFMV